MEEPCGVALIGACLPRRVVAWERTQGAVVEATQGFTLLELAIVLTVIGLIVGGILWGADMIGAAATRAQISQIQKFDAAVNTFRTKYNALPGDIQASQAAQFGFVPRAGTQGRGDGDGLLEGYNYTASQAYTCTTANNCFITGEPMFFWEDLASANLIDGGFNRAMDAADTVFCVSAVGGCSGRNIYQVLPYAKLGNNNFVFVYSSSGMNYFNIFSVSQIDFQGFFYSNDGLPGVTVAQAYNIDKKIDDGLPTTGKVLAQVYYNSNWWTGGWMPSGNPDTVSTCYNSSTLAYSMNQNNGAYPNCALSFRFQE